MKKSIILLNLLLVGELCQALPVDVQKAQKVAQKVLKGQVTLRADMGEMEAKRRGEAHATLNAPAYYIFSREEGKGFAIISGESELPSLVAYSRASEFSSVDDLHPGLADFLDAYTALVNDVREGKSVSYAPRKEEGIPVVGPLCQTQWNQGAPYNVLCPMDGNKRCPVGCVALAMAQIMKHYEWPKVGTGKMTYTPGLTGVGALSVDFSQSHYDWDAMLNTTAELNTNETAAAAVAKLCYDCGVATKMGYTAASSGTYDDFAIQAMYEFFGYKASTIGIVYRDCYATQEEWDRIWKTELDAGRPILYAGASTSGGHEFVVDGYDSNDFVHVNWGWGGKSDGFFDVTLLNASPAQSYTQGQSMIIGIEPDETGEDKVHAPVVPFMDTSLTLTGSLDLNKNKTLMVQKIANRSRSAQTWFFGVGLYDLNGNLVKKLTENEVSKTINSMTYMGGMATVRFNIPADTPEGNYIISLIFRPMDYDEWLLPNVVGGAAQNMVYTEIKDGKATFGEIPASIYNICVEDGAGSATVVSHEYFDMSGRPLQNVTRGIVIDRQMLSNGKKIVVKRRF